MTNLSTTLRIEPRLTPEDRPVCPTCGEDWPTDYLGRPKSVPCPHCEEENNKRWLQGRRGYND